MKYILVLVLCICSTTYSRLLEKNTARTITTKTKTGAVRLIRQIEDIDTFAGISREDTARSEEFLSYYNNKVEHFNKSKIIRSDSHVRKPRESGEHNNKGRKNVTAPPVRNLVTQAKTKPNLVKKPIPKYNDMEYDEDFQMKINKSPVGFIDSGEHEDEDFNLDDYDFDVNHDEFVGRGKPLEPRLKHKEQYVPAKAVSKPAAIPEVKTKHRANIPAQNPPISIKKERSIQAPKKGEKEDYYDDVTSTKATEKPRILDDESNDDIDDTKEYFKQDPVRRVRSPRNLHADKIEEKPSNFQFLSGLPMFPQVPKIPGKQNFEYNNIVHGVRKNAWRKKSITR